MSPRPALHLAAAIGLALCGAALAGPLRFAEQPDIHGESLVFSLDGDLWGASVAGGVAHRLTSWPGVESRPRFSPDGRWLAFSADYDGPQAVYLMPSQGGEPRRLSWNPDGAAVLGWTPDGTRVLFRSNLEQVATRASALYTVSREGGAPARLPVDRGTLACYSPDGNTLLYCRRGAEEYAWRRYRGGNNPDIWALDLPSLRFTQLCDGTTRNAFPMWVDGAMVFASDRDGTVNLYRMDLPQGTPQPLTHHAEADLHMPESDGHRVVYLHESDLHVLDPATGEDRVVPVEVPAERWRTRPRSVLAKEFIQSADVDGQGRTTVFEARGEIFRVSVDPKGPTRNLSRSPASRERFPRLSPDGRQVAFFSDRSGEYQLYLQSVEGGAWKALTQHLDCAVYRPVWSPDGLSLLFGDKNLDLHVVTVATGAERLIRGSRRLKNDEFTWEIDDYAWSPDSRWVAYTQVAENRNSQVWLWEAATGRSTVVTGDFDDNLHPRFDTTGDFLYFLSSRNSDVLMDFHEDNHVLARPYQVMAMALRKGLAPAFLVDAPDTTTHAARESQKPQASVPSMRVDLEGMAARVWPLPVPAGNLFHLSTGPGRVLWTSVPAFTEDEYEEIFRPGGDTKWTLHAFDLDKGREVRLEEEIASCQLSADGRQLLTLADGRWTVRPLERLAAPEEREGRDGDGDGEEGGRWSRRSRRDQDETPSVAARGESLSLDGVGCVVDPRAEWAQIFEDCWRWYRDFFYDRGMHGHDWLELGRRYRAMLPDVGTRGQLNTLLSRMVGELCVGHTYISGGDEGAVRTPAPPTFTGRLGADLVADAAAGRWKLGRIYGPTPIHGDVTGPLARPDLQLREGLFLLSIDDVPLRHSDDYWRLLQVLPGQKLRLEFASTPDGKDRRTVEVEPLRDDHELRYAAWVAQRVKQVEDASQGRLGYIHLRSMGGGDVGDFDRFWRAYRYRDGVILDVRRNGGGWTEYFIIDKLERRPVSCDVLQGMEPFIYPGSVNPRQAYVAISNEDNASDGEAFISHFQSRALGPVVGTPSWGGLVGILNGQRTVDNGMVQQPNNAFYGLDGQWDVENVGAQPDIWQDNDPASVLEGRDLQLEKAIQVLLEKVKATPSPIPAGPPLYPRR